MVGPEVSRETKMGGGKQKPIKKKLEEWKKCTIRKLVPTLESLVIRADVHQILQ